ncbi:MAG: hypothetical protein CM15mP23_04880 [Cryomorphaceae bacterium]|nr:MAG: hypothetical protein CM15mP23_04880 [Cryomorphaceae bacterium]
MMATNYNELAVANDGSCEYPSSETCEEAIAMDSTATGYYFDNDGIQYHLIPSICYCIYCR